METNNRRDLLKKAALAGASALVAPSLFAGEGANECWTNAETFDRDMPIRFRPIKFDKLRMKLEAGHLYDRYREYFEIK